MLLEGSRNGKGIFSALGRDNVRGEHTWLEYQCAANVDVSTVARRLDALGRADEGADDERGSLADAVEGPK